jgi:hypothetical protein
MTFSSGLLATAVETGSPGSTGILNHLPMPEKKEKSASATHMRESFSW